MNTKMSAMNCRQRFRETMRHGSPDRVPLFEEGIREDVFKMWRQQGLSRRSDLSKMFSYDTLDWLEPDLDPRPRLKKWPYALPLLDVLKQRLNPEDTRRLPRRWRKKIRTWQKRDHVLMLRVSQGFFLSMGVYGWKRFKEVIHLLTKDPELVREAMKVQGLFAAKLTEKILQDVDIDAAVFVEPIAENHGPLISPKMYEELVLPGYQPILEVLGRYGVETIIFLSFANPKLLIPSILKVGFNCLWAYEVNMEAMDYRNLFREFGKDLRLIGGIDLDSLRHGKEVIRREIEQKVPLLLANGGYIPMVDGRVREDIPFENYAYYRRSLEKVVQG
jgi:uroporphyrinogen decarboxylase